MEFNPDNSVVKLCLKGMTMADNNNPEAALAVFIQAWKLATRDFEKFIAAHFMARCQNTVVDKLDWLETTLHIATAIDDDTVRSALPTLYTELAGCHEALDDPVQARRYRDLANRCETRPADKGPFYHGTKADLAVGDLLTAGGLSNYAPELKMNHIYFTGQLHGAGLSAELAKGDSAPRVYQVEPTGDFEDDPNVTNKKFPGNPTRSYRSRAPLKIIGEVTTWKRLDPEALQAWRDKLARGSGNIIN